MLVMVLVNVVIIGQMKNAGNRPANWLQNTLNFPPYFVIIICSSSFGLFLSIFLVFFSLPVTLTLIRMVENGGNWWKEVAFVEGK